MEQEQRSENTGDNNKRENQQVEVKLIWSVSSTATAIWLFLIGVFFLWIFLPDYVPDRADRAKVFIESIFSLGIVIVVVVHAIMYYKQAKAMDAQVQQSERAIKAAENNVETVEKTAVYANRAYVVAKIRGAGREWPQLRLRIQNTGNTPANNVIVAYACGLREEPPHREWPDGLVSYDIGYAEVERLGLIAPQSSYHVIETPLVVALDNAQTDQWRGGKLKFYCWGRISYEDIFNDKRWTEFCFVKSESHEGGYPCKHGNQAI